MNRSTADSKYGTETEAHGMMSGEAHTYRLKSRNKFMAKPTNLWHQSEEQIEQKRQNEKKPEINPNMSLGSQDK